MSHQSQSLPAHGNLPPPTQQSPTSSPYPPHQQPLPVPSATLAIARDGLRTMDSYMDRFRIRPMSRPGTPGSTPRGGDPTNSPSPSSPPSITGSPATISSTPTYAVSSGSALASISTSASTSTPETRTPAPVSGRVKACDRCRVWKKKCTRHLKVPTKCINCINAGAECSLRVLNTSQTGLRARLAWLENFVNSQGFLSPEHPIEHVSTGTDLEMLMGLRDNGEQAAGSGSGPRPAQERMLLSGCEKLISMDSRDEVTDDPPKRGFTTVNQSQYPGHHSSSSQEQYLLHQMMSHHRSEPMDRDLPPGSTERIQRISKEVYRILVDAYFRDVGRGYPFIDRQRAATLVEQAEPAIRCVVIMDSEDPSSVLLALMIAIGHSSLERAGKLPPDVIGLHFEVRYEDILSQCILHESRNTVEILLLLALYTLTDPEGPSSQPILDIVGHQAIRLGLAQRDTLDDSLTPEETERSHRLFWSIYILDRMMAVSCGLPVSLNMANPDIPMPGLTVSEFASPAHLEFVSMLQVTRQLIHLRQLEDKILHQIHLRNNEKMADLTKADRFGIVKSLRTEIENWYSNGCLLKPTENDNVPIHITVSWLAARYYNLLLLLYYPSRFNPGSLLLSRKELLSLAQKHIQANAVRFQQRQLPLNEPTLCRLLPVVTIFLHCFLLHCSEDGPFAARDEVMLCATILGAYPKAWKAAHRGAEIVRQLAALITICLAYDSMPFASTQNRSLSESDRAWLNAVKVGMVELTREVLGRGSAFQIMEHWEDGKVGGKSGSERGSPKYREIQIDSEEQPVPEDQQHLIMTDFL